MWKKTVNCSGGNTGKNIDVRYKVLCKSEGWMKMESKYSSVLTGASFMLYELKQIVVLKEKGLSEKEIRTKVITDNLFQHNKISSLKRGLPSLLRRVNVLNESLIKLVVEESLEVGKVINLYTIMKTDLLFFEFMNEVIKEKFQMSDYSFEKKDLNTFFTVKAEQDENIANWTEATVQKLKQVYIKILLEAGILKDKRSGDLNRLVIDDRVRNHLINMGDFNYLDAMGE
jgi:hypothetical protein